MTGPVFRSYFRETVSPFSEECKFLKFCYSFNRVLALLQPQITWIVGPMEENL